MNYKTLVSYFIDEDNYNVSYIWQYLYLNDVYEDLRLKKIIDFLKIKILKKDNAFFAKIYSKIVKKVKQDLIDHLEDDQEYYKHFAEEFGIELR
jgi:hypothetical protein